MAIESGDWWCEFARYVLACSRLWVFSRFAADISGTIFHPFTCANRLLWQGLESTAGCARTAATLAACGLPKGSTSGNDQ
jgi:hypothetical protein